MATPLRLRLTLLAACLSLSAVPDAAEEADARVAWWRKARFGLFVHWGPVSLPGTAIGWSRAGERRFPAARAGAPGPAAFVPRPGSAEKSFSGAGLAWISGH